MAEIDYDSRSPPLVPFLSAAQQRKALAACSPDIYDKMNLEEIFPYLCEHNLLTDTEQEQLQSMNTRFTRKEKISMLITSLPRKGSDALARFVECLKSSTEGTAHEELAYQIEVLVDDQMQNKVTPQHKYGMSTVIVGGILLVGAILVVGIMYYPTVMYYVNKESSKSLPYLSDHFIGRDDEMNEIVELLNFKTSITRVVNVYGSPGFGKSTLAIHVGHIMLQQGAIVHYVNLQDFPKKGIKLVLAEKILQTSSIHDKSTTFGSFLNWVRERNLYTLIVLDNCDDSLHHQREELQDAIEKIIENSPLVKFLMTSREVVMLTGGFEQYKLFELSTKAACDLLQRKVPKGTKLTAPEKEEIAKITGNVPLALQIIGSLLRLPATSTGDILAELKKQPILTLSPQLLPKNKQIYASFSLSYNYLSADEKMIGKLLAIFPGSFNQEAYKAVLKYLLIAEEKTISDAINILVQRSLLEYQKHHERYYFHCLIREYFLEKCRESISNQSITLFMANFQAYYLGQLDAAIHQFGTQSFAKSLAILDTERHNFVQLMNDIKACNIVFNFTYVGSVMSVAFETGLLACRFSPNELLEITRSLITYLDRSISAYHDKGEIPTIWKQLYLYYVYQLVKLEQSIHSMESALSAYHHYKARVDAFKPPPQSKGANIYMQIQVLVSNVCSGLGHHNNSIHHYKIVLEYSKRALKDCETAACSYKDIGYHLRLGCDFKNAAIFLNLSISVEKLDLFERLETLNCLIEVYQYLGQNDDADRAFENIVSLLPTVLASSSNELYQHVDTLYSLISCLRDKDRMNEADMLEGRAVQVIIDIGANDHYSKKLLYSARTIYIVKLLYRKSNYAEAIKIGTYALNSYEKIPELEKYEYQLIRLLFVIGKAKYYSGNYSEGLNDIEDVLNYIIKNANIISSHVDDEYWESCFYLIPRFRYIHTCFWSPILKVVYGTAYLIFVSPLSCSQTSNHDFKEQEKSFFPELTHIKLSSRRDVEVVSDDSLSMLAQRFSEIVHQHFILNFYQRIYQGAWLVYHKLMIFMNKNPLICFLLNVVSIFLRIYFTLLILSLCHLGFVVKTRYILVIKYPLIYTLMRSCIAKIYNAFLMNQYLNKFSFLILLFMYVSKLLWFYCVTLPIWFIFIHIFTNPLAPNKNAAAIINILIRDDFGFTFLITSFHFILLVLLLVLLCT